MKIGRTAHRGRHRQGERGHPWGAPSHHRCQLVESGGGRPSLSFLPGWWFSLFSFDSAGESGFGGGVMAEQPALLQATKTGFPFPQGQFNLSLTAPSPSAPVQRFLLLLHGSSGVCLQSSPSYDGVEVRKWVSKLVLRDIAVLCQGAGDMSHAAKGGTSDHASQPCGISLSQPQVTKAQKYVGFTCFGCTCTLSLCWPGRAYLWAQE